MFTGPNIITDGLVLHLDAANPKSYPGSGTTWNDLSGNGNDLTIFNNPIYSNNTFQLDPDSYFGSPNNFMGTSNATNVSYTFYIKFNWGNVSGYRTIFGFQQSFFERVANFVLNTGSSKLQFDIRNNGVNNRGIFDFNMAEFSNTMCFISYTFNNGQHKLYINSENVVTQTRSLTTFPIWSTGPGGFGVGNNLSSNRHLESGVFSHVSVYLKTLTASEVLQNYNATKSRFGL